MMDVPEPATTDEEVVRVLVPVGMIGGGIPAGSVERGIELGADIIAVDGGDRSVAIYDIASGVAVGDPIDIPDDQINAIALRPDGLELAVGGSRAVGPEVWDLDPRHWIDAACRVAGRNLTHAEWESNIGALRPYRLTCAQFPAGV